MNSSVIVSIIFLVYYSSVFLILYRIYICMVADIEMADRPHDDPYYMEDAIQNMINDGSQYFIDYNEIMQGNPIEQQEGNAPE